jgi:hypothetical protein
MGSSCGDSHALAQLLDGAMAYDADVGLRDAEEGGQGGGGLLVIEGHDDYGALAFLEVLEAPRKLVEIEARGEGVVLRQECVSELLKQALFSLDASAEVEDAHAAGTEDERGELAGMAETARAQGFESGEEDLLGQVIGGVFVPEVAEAVEADAWRHAADQFCFGFAVVTAGDAADQFGVVEL